MPPDGIDVDPADLPSNWDRWGPRDQLGALHFVTPEARARGVAEAREGRHVSLAHPVTPVPMSAPFPFETSGMPAGVLQLMNFTTSPPRVLTDVLVINTHHVSLTHIDALVHVPADGQIFPGVPLEEAAAFGRVGHGSTESFAAGIVTRGVLLDLLPGDRLASDQPITPVLLEEAEQRHGVEVTSGDALILRGGWRMESGLTDPPPWVTLESVAWMGEREICLYASDVGDKFNPLGPGIPMPLHQVALPRLGIPLIDNVDVDPLGELVAELGRATFLFVLGAMAVIGATGIPVNPIAVF